MVDVPFAQPRFAEWAATTSVDLSFRTGDGVMRLRLNAEKAFNPITQQPFKGFRLPRGLLQQPLKICSDGVTL
jgi:type VI secretion system protein ImpL